MGKSPKPPNPYAQGAAQQKSELGASTHGRSRQPGPNTTARTISGPAVGVREALMPWADAWFKHTQELHRRTRRALADAASCADGAPRRSVAGAT